MKVSTSTNKGFQPVTVEITLETKEELDRFGTIFNHQGIGSFFGFDRSYDVRETLKMAGADVGRFFALLQGMIR